jgi:hypothetical protein
MSQRPSHRQQHEAAELERAIDARISRVRAHETDVRRLLDERWWRRVQPVLPVTEDVYDPDFDGCVW